MKRQIEKKGINAYIGNYTPRKNEYEKGLKYRLFVSNIPTNFYFSTIKDCKSWFDKNYYIFM